MFLEQRPIDDPRLNCGDEHFFAAAAAGKLVLRHCNACDGCHHYPRSHCPFCLSSDVTWKEASGLGVVYSYSVMPRGNPGPYCIAYVTLDEGVTMLSNIVGCNADAVSVGKRVQVTFAHSPNGTAVPMFRMAD